MKRLLMMILPLVLRRLGKSGAGKRRGRGARFDDRRMRQGVWMLRRFLKF